MSGRTSRPEIVIGFNAFTRVSQCHGVLAEDRQPQSRARPGMALVFRESLLRFKR
jgi:hypothetical protein